MHQVAYLREWDGKGETHQLKVNYYENLIKLVENSFGKYFGTYRLSTPRFSKTPKTKGGTLRIEIFFVEGG